MLQTLTNLPMLAKGSEARCGRGWEPERDPPMLALLCASVGLLPRARLNIRASQPLALRDVQHAVFAVAALVHTTTGATDFHNSPGKLSVNVVWTCDQDDDPALLDEGVSLHASFLHGEALEERLRLEAERALADE